MDIFLHFLDGLAHAFAGLLQILADYARVGLSECTVSEEQQCSQTQGSEKERLKDIHAESVGNRNTKKFRGAANCRNTLIYTMGITAIRGWFFSAVRADRMASPGTHRPSGRCEVKSGSEFAVGAGAHHAVHLGADVYHAAAQLRRHADLFAGEVEPGHVPVHHQYPDMLVGVLHDRNPAG